MQSCGGREHVRSLSLGGDGARERQQAESLHEILHGESLGLDIGIVGHSPRVDVGLGCESSAPLSSREVGIQSAARLLEMSVDTYALRYLDGFLRGRIECRRHESQVVGVSLECQVGFHRIEVSHMVDGARSSEIEGRRQFHVEVAHGEPLQVASHLSVDVEGLVRPSCDHTRRQGSSGEPHNVGFAKIAIHLSEHLSRLLAVEGIEIHLEVCRQP